MNKKPSSVRNYRPSVVFSDLYNKYKNFSGQLTPEQVAELEAGIAKRKEAVGKIVASGVRSSQPSILGWEVRDFEKLLKWNR